MKRNKILKRLVSLSLAFCMTFGVAALTGCNCNNNNGSKTHTTYNNEEDALVFSTQEVDKVFNPFFSTSGTDSSVVGMTQIGMLTNDKNGSVAYGPDEAVVTEVFESKYDAESDTTTYYFVLKNNIRFSNGSYLSMKDVLFNYYVYLDPVYSGSSTIYSTDIVGLKQYRTQEDNEAEQDSFKAQFEAKASDRIGTLAEVATEILDDNKGANLDETSFRTKLQEYMEANSGDAYKNLVKDYDAALPMFRNELQKDFTNAKDSYADLVFVSEVDGKDVEHKNVITTDVEMFLYNENYLKWNKKEGKMESALTLDPAELKTWTEEKAISTVYESKVPNDIAEIVQYWGTATELFDSITNQEMQEYFKDKDRKYNNISGIKFANRTQAVTLPSGKTYQPPQYEDGEARTHVKEGFNEVLSITIKKVDPKAVWNFSLGIAPMYYYSDAAHIQAFDYESNFGVEYSSADFMNDVVKAPNKVGVPVGAGMYAASTSAGGIDASKITVGTFCDQNIIYFERNPYFVMGPAKIKKVRYQVIGSSAMLPSLYSGGIDFVEPNAKTETVTELEGKADEGIYSDHYMTSGYGYIGINAGKVPTLAVRQAIMHAIDTHECIAYYGTTAEPIYRAMSKANWAYPKNATAYYPYIGGEIPENLAVVNPAYAEYVREKGKKSGEKFTEAEQIEFITSLIEGAGYTKGSDGVYVNGSNKLKYTFTIAGEQQDHPAWMALYKAGLFLNKCGFNINTTTDSNALRKLASGDLTVWAAAWSSTIDPDMYQVYHRDSTATSTLNWGYKQIKQNAGGKYDTESAIVNELSELIEQARETNDQTIRANLYSQALDKVMELAVELPTYQRDDLFACNANKIDVNTFIPKAERTPYQGMTSKLYQVSLVIA